MNAMKKLLKAAKSGEIQKGGKGLPMRNPSPKVEFAPAISVEEFFRPLPSSAAALRAKRNR